MLVSVSYTHLDVYKRQGYEQTITIDYQKNNKKFSCSIPIDKNSNEEEILKEIRKIIK